MKSIVPVLLSTGGRVLVAFALAGSPRAAWSMAEGQLFSQVTQDKTTVCANEDVRIDVTPTSNDPRLAVFVDGELGNPGVVSLTKAGTYTIPVQAMLGDTVQHGAATIAVVECPDRKMVRVKSTMAPSSLHRDRVIFEAETSFDKRLYTFSWEFGDGTVDARKSMNVIDHSYSMRPQGGPYSTFLVTVTVRYVPLLSTIQPYVVGRARHTVAFANPEYIAKESGQLKVPTEVRWHPNDAPAADNHERVIRIGNIHAATVALTGASVTGVLCATGETQALPEKPLSYFFGAAVATTIPAGAVWTGTLNVKGTDFTGKVCKVEVSLKGNVGALKGIPGLSRFVFDAERHIQWKETEASPIVTADGRTERTVTRSLQDVVISDPATQDMLKKAMKLVGRNQVTVYDLVRLRAEGRIEDLVVHER